MRIFMFCSSLGHHKGWTERTASELANRLSNKHYTVAIGYLSTNDVTKTVYDIENKVLKIEWIQKDQSIINFKEKIMQFKPDVCIYFGGSSQIIEISAILYGTRIPIIIQEDINPNHIIRDDWAKLRNIPVAQAAWEREVILAQASQIKLSVSSYKKYFSKDLEHKIKVFPNILEQYFVNKKKKILSIGTYINIASLIKSFTNIYRDFPDWELCIFLSLEQNVEDKEYSEIIDLINQYNAGHVIKIIKEFAALELEYSNAAIHVVSSESINVSNSIAEAMRYGIPTIGIQNDYELTEFIQKGNDGLLVQTNEKFVENLEESLELLMKNDEKRQELGNNAQKKSELHSELVLKRWDEIIDNALMTKSYEASLNSYWMRSAYDLYCNVVGEETFLKLESIKFNVLPYSQDMLLTKMFLSRKMLAMTNKESKYE